MNKTAVTRLKQYLAEDRPSKSATAATEAMSTMYNVHEIAVPLLDGNAHFTGESEPSLLDETSDTTTTTQQTRVDAVAYISDRAALLLALVTSNNYVVFVYGKPGCLEDGRLTFERYRWRPPNDTTKITCACFSASGRWLVLLLDNGSVEVLPTKLALLDVTTECQDPGHMPLFPEDETTKISLKVRDDCLQLPTCALWYETKNSRRPMLIYSNKGGDILFVDLLLRKLSVSLQAPQSIHHLDIVEDAATTGTYDTHLLVTGFANTQWLVPLEIGGQSVRETLSHIVPSELKEIAPHGIVYAIAGSGAAQKCVGLLRSDTPLFEVYTSLDLSMPSCTINVPLHTWHVHYTPLFTIAFANEHQVHIRLNVGANMVMKKTVLETMAAATPSVTVSDSESSNSNEPANAGVNGVAGQLPSCRFISLVPIRFKCKSGELPSFLALTENGVVSLRPQMQLQDVFINCLQPKFSKNVIVQLCEAADVPVQSTAMGVISRLLQNDEQQTSMFGDVSPVTLVKMIGALELPVIEVAGHFITSGHGQLMLPLLTQELSRVSGNEQQKDKLSGLMFQLRLRLTLDSHGYNNLTRRNEFKDFLLHHLWFSSDLSVMPLLEAKLWDCVSVALRLHDQNEIVMRYLLQLSEWQTDEDFVCLATRPNFAASFYAHQDLCYEYLRRLSAFAVNSCTSKRRLVMLLNLTNPARTEISKVLKVNNEKRLDPVLSGEHVSSALCTQIIELYIHSLFRFVHASSQRHQLVPVSCGVVHSAAITTDGLFVWGGGEKKWLLGPNFEHRPIVPKAASKEKGVKVETSYVNSVQPVAVPLPMLKGRHAIAVSCGAEHTLVLDDGGQLYSFGCNRFGQLGVGDRQNSADVHVVHVWDSNGDNVRLRAIRSGMYHCMAVSDTDELYTWGWAVHGQLGHGGRHLNDALRPTRVQWFVDQNIAIADVAGGQAHTLVLNKSGKVYVFGSGANGQMGIGRLIKKHTKPTLVQALCDMRVVRIACGQFHSLATTDRDQVYTWGATPSSLKFKAMLNKRKNNANTGGGQQEGGQVDKKDNKDKQQTVSAAATAEGTPVGADETSHLIPSLVTSMCRQMTSSPSNNTDNVMQMSCGATHSALITQQGQLYTWGKSLEYQLGHGDRKERQTPTILTNAADPSCWRYVACGLEYTIAVDRTGAIWCWGRNDMSQLGFETVPTTDQHRLAGKVLTIQRGKGPQRTITLPKDGRAYCQQPTKLTAVVANTIDLELPQSVSIYDENALHMAIRKWAGDYDPMRLAKLAQDVGLYRVAAYVWLVNNTPTAALRMHARALEQNGVDLTYPEVRDMLECYRLVIPSLSDTSERRESLRLLFTSTPHLVTEHLQFYFDVEWNVWASSLLDMLRSDPASMRRFSADFKLRLIESTLNTPSSTVNQPNSDSSPGAAQFISQTDIEDEHQTLSFSFVGCGHFLSETALNTQLARLHTQHRLNSVLPQTAATVQNLYVPSDPSGAYCPLNTQLCPTCLGNVLSEFANEIDVA